MTRRERLNTGIRLHLAAGGILAVGLALNGVVGQALVYGAALCAIAGVVCLALGALVRR